MNRSLCALLCALLLALCACAAPEPEEAQASFFAMNTYMTMTAYGAGAQAAVDRAQARIEALESLWSVTQEGSDIYAVNHVQGQPVAVHEETAALLSFALDMAEETGGALEPTLYPVLAAWGFTADAHRVPEEAELAALLENVDYARVRVQGETVQLDPGMMLDLGAVGKGYAGDLAAQALREGGVESALLNLGGNVQAIGARPDGSPWRLELRNPFGEGGLGLLLAQDCAVITSGNYENCFVAEDGTVYGHILDPEKGRPADSGLASVTIVAQEGRLGDALSTSLFVMGAQRAEAFWRERGGFDMILVTQAGEILVTEGIADAFTPYEDQAAVRVLTREVRADAGHFSQENLE